MSNIYLKVTIEKNRRSQNFLKTQFSKFKKFATRSVFGDADIIEF